jgi:hypothetical protein
MKLFTTLLENVNKSRTSAGNLSLIIIIMSIPSTCTVKSVLNGHPGDKKLWPHETAHLGQDSVIANALQRVRKRLVMHGM